jgi:SAM-dependent methyltransferase
VQSPTLYTLTARRRSRERAHIREIFHKLRHEPFGAIARGLNKQLLAPRRYSRGDGYDAARYWRDRFARYGASLKGAGDEGLSEEENRRRYEEAAGVFAELCRSEGIDLRAARVLEVGCGSGYYTELLANLGVSSYVGLDITDVLFPELRDRFPEFDFEQGDITTDDVEGTYDLIVLIDVIEHIVEDEKLSSAMEHLKGALAPGGVLVLAPVTPRPTHHLFYVRLWSLEEVRERFPGYVVGDPEPFRAGGIVAIRKPLG